MITQAELSDLVNALDDSVEDFTDAFNRIKHKLTYDDCLRKVEDGSHRGAPLLWLVLEAADEDYPEAFFYLWDKHQDHFTLEQFRAKMVTGSHPGESMLLKLGDITNRHPGIFLAILKRFKKSMLIEDLRAKAEFGVESDRTLLWQLVYAATLDHPEPFLAVWKKHKNNITLEDLCTTNSDSSVLWRLAYAAFVKNQMYIGKIFKKLLMEMPFILNDKELKEQQPVGNILSIADIIAQYQDKSTALFLQNLIKARNNLFDAILKAQIDETLTFETVKALSHLAEEAFKAGYINAYYDVGMLFLEKKKPTTASLLSARILLEKSPVKAKQFINAKAETVTLFLDQAFTSEGAKREHSVSDALWFALRMTDEGERISMLQKIAYCHVYKKEKQMTDDPAKIIEPSPLRCLSKNSPIKDCLKLFEHQYERMNLAAKNVSTQSPAPILFSELGARERVESLPVRGLPQRRNKLNR